MNLFQQAIGSELQEEPHISLNVKNQPLDSVLAQISQDTGFTFEINEQWAAHPIIASIKDVPLHRGLKHILRRLNHTILYEQDNNIKIVIYGTIKPAGTHAAPNPSFSSREHYRPPEPVPLPEPPPEEPEDSGDEVTDSEKEDDATDSKKDGNASKEEADKDAGDQSSEKTNE